MPNHQVQRRALIHEQNPSSSTVLLTVAVAAAAAAPRGDTSIQIIS